LPATLADWLSHLEALHPKSIALGLDRVERVKMALALKPDFPIFIVGGTNGKGSTCAMLESVLGVAGYAVALYASPHLLRYNERVRVNRREASDDALCEAFAAVEAARGDVPLTYFEFGTLAALWLFVRERAEVAVLEVGLGGRLDAVNAFEPDCSVVTSVALDHMDFLGSTPEAIGLEKAGIYRTGKPAVFGERNAPASLTDHAKRIGARLLRFGQDFGYVRERQQWQFWGPRGKHYSLPFPALRGDYQLQNASSCLAALAELRERIPVSLQHIKRGLNEVELQARLQVLPGRPAVILDVAHNPHAAQALARNLKAMTGFAKTHAVFGMLKDKDICGVIAAVADAVDHWYVAGIEAPRGASAEHLASELARLGYADRSENFASLAQAFDAVCNRAAQDDRILVFGSFYTVAEILKHRHVLGQVR
jgi:dihydrofolate synthase / folylpolyglutamate synthase